MKLTSAQVKKLLVGNHAFSQLSFSMLFTRLKGVYAKDPSQEVLEEATNEINAFLEKFKVILAKDLLTISDIIGG
jgi:hypothetical protein